MARLLVLALLIALALGACGADDASDPDGNASVDQEWGPLAVIDGPPNVEDAATGGILTISDVCVTLNQPGTDGTTLAWPSEATTWNPDKGTILYGDNETIELSDGDEVTFSGGFKNASSNVEWVVEPDPSCPREGAFFVGHVSEGFDTGP